MADRSANTYRTDPDLVQACLNGDEPAWKELVERYGRLVYSIPLRYGLSHADADEVFQNVFIVVHRRLSTLRDQKLLTPWLIRVTHREAIRFCKQVRGVATEEEAELDETTPDGAEPAIDQARRWERQQYVRQALEQLDPRCRALLTALFLDSNSQTYAEIAAKLDIDVGSIGPTRSRCFKKLEQILRAMGVDLDV